MNIPEIDPKEVLGHDYQLIDVRTPEEFSGELHHVPGSKLITLGPELNKFLEEAELSEKIVFICRSGNRSGQATAYAMSQGFNAVFNMTGGMLLWNELGLEVEK